MHNKSVLKKEWPLRTHVRTIQSLQERVLGILVGWHPKWILVCW